MNDDKWSKDIAALISDALLDGGVIEEASFDRASEIIAEEIWVRLLCGDYPPGATDPGKRVIGPQDGSSPATG